MLFNTPAIYSCISPYDLPRSIRESRQAQAASRPLYTQRTPTMPSTSTRTSTTEVLSLPPPLLLDPPPNLLFTRLWIFLPHARLTISDEIGMRELRGIVPAVRARTAVTAVVTTK